MAYSSGAENLKRRRLHLQSPENIAEASPEFFIGPQKEKLRSKYRASSLEHNGYPVFYAEGRPGRDAEWIFRAGDGFQCNYGNSFETSRPRYWTPDNPWVPGNHSWEQFISKTGEWKLFGQFETTVIQRQDSLLAGCVNASESAGEHGSTKVLPVDELLYSQDSISPHFSDKRPLKELIDQLNAWELDPMKAGFLCLDVMEINGKVYSVDNRRLYCLKQHQASAQPWQVFAKVKVTPVEDPLLVRVLVRGLKNGGREIRVREPGVDIGREGPNIRRF
eukprot:s868_g30.t2